MGVGIDCAIDLVDGREHTFLCDPQGLCHFRAVLEQPCDLAVVVEQDNRVFKVQNL